GTEALAIAYVPASLGGAALRDTAEHRHAAIHGCHHRLDEAPFFFGSERLVLPERTEENDAGDAGLDDRFRLARGGVEVERAVLFHLRGDGRENALPVGFHELLLLLLRVCGRPLKGKMRFNCG